MPKGRQRSVITRRKFLATSSLLGAGLALRPADLLAQRHHIPPQPSPELDPSRLAKFVDPLPIPPRARPSPFPSPQPHAEYRHFFRIPLREITTKLHRDLNPTRMWSCAGSVPGPTVEARSGDGVMIEWANHLPAKHFLPIDHHLHGAEHDKPEVRAVMHLHGAKVPPESDGYPEDWKTPGQSVIYRYPNRQDAATLWYHDHAMGINRLNIYAGLFGMFLIRDAFEDGLNLPKGDAEIPLVFFDRMLTRDGQLLYPVSGDPEAPWVSEASGEAILINGKLFPYLDVAPRRYRFRLLNASNSRMYELRLQNDLPFYQIATEQGLLAAPAKLQNLEFAPAERADIVIDFSEHRGEQITLINDQTPILQFRVGRTKVTDVSSLPKTLRPFAKIPESQAVRTRVLTLNEYENKAGDPILLLLNASYWHQPVTEKPLLNSTEIWSFVNPTDDTHPIHLHLVRFQILDRQPYIPTLHPEGELRFLGPRVPPGPDEAGWKDTVRAHSHMVTRIIVPFEGYTGRYVWHCHILEHEDNEMMRPFEVLPPA